MAGTVHRMGRRRLEDNKTCYSGAVAARLHELRDKQGWTMEEFLRKLSEVGVRYECPECRKSHIGVRMSLDVPCPRYDCGGVPEAYELVLPLRTAYSYESGKHKAEGADLPSDFYPVIAAVYGYTTVIGWLPSNLGE